MSAAAGFHGDNAGRQLTEERQHLIPPQLLAQDRPTIGVSPMRLKHILRQIEPDREPKVRAAIISDMTVLLCGSSQTHLGTPMPSGGGHIIRAGLPPKFHVYDEFHACACDW